MFEPRLAAASLSGESDADWAKQAAPHVGCAFLGGIALDSATREAAREMVDRERTEFLPEDPIAFIDEQLTALESADVRAAFNVRSATLEPIAEAAAVCADHDAILEINAHCRQEEMCAAGAGQSLLRDGDRLCEQVATAADAGADVSVKVRTEVEGVDLPALSARLADAGADALHVDAMDSEPVVAEVAEAAPETFLIANNGVRDRATAYEYLEYGADAVSVGRPSDNPTVLRRIREAVDEWFTTGDRLDPEVSPDA
ncbi:tRNA-dihydrouridine synthase [Natronomonas halophila]|uniref:tRNA-dihydrouridine synthase n=1 Tax=Natronomonas halophila TaxID=2747817 RepID=UPI0015B3D84B|nr:tRNA-dihydrouridine synthase [Natronomonas halophila]QLD84855.1 tRNA-dihydrouridine synthase [Natronomonas halophila]